MEPVLQKFPYHDGPHKTFQYTVELPEKPEAGMQLLNIPGVCSCEIRRILPVPENFRGDVPSGFDCIQNYHARANKENDLVLEASIYVTSKAHPEWNQFRVGIALAEVPEIRRFTILYNGPEFLLIGNGKILDSEWPFGDPAGEPVNSEPLQKPERVSATFDGPLQYWSPDGMNAWCGDIAPGFINGEYHVFYLYDRRHHFSKYGMGSHQWGHLVTKDFKIWRNDGLVLPIQEQWQTYGTGTPFILDGKLALSFGYHTDRILPEEVAPTGASWMTSEDGMNFTPSGYFYAKSPNPSIFTNLNAPFTAYCGYGYEGKLYMLEAEKWPEFHIASEEVVPHGAESSAGNSMDCPSVFKWHGFYYIIVGAKGMWRGTTPDFHERYDLTGNEEDVYDGGMVPMVTDIGNDRRIMAAWLSNQSKGGFFGSVIILRELVWFPDAVLGTKWFDEVMPVFTGKREFTGGAVTPEFLLEMDVQPGADFTIRLEGKGEPVELRFAAGAKRMELAFASRKGKTTLETPRDQFESACARAARHIHNVDKPFKVRLMVNDQRKMRGAIVDAEIAGSRTLVQHFGDFHAERVQIIGRTGRVTVAETRIR